MPGMRKRNLPGGDSGHWSGEIGDSVFIVDDKAKFNVGNEVYTGRQIKDTFGIEGIRYKGTEPDFSTVVDNNVGIVSLEGDIPSTRRGYEGRNGTYDIAEQEVLKRNPRFNTVGELRKYMKEHNLTWHECSDLRTIMPIPTAINTVFKHTGGISTKKDKETIKEIFTEKLAGGKIEPSPKGIKTKVEGMDEFKRKEAEEFRRRKRQRK